MPRRPDLGLEERILNSAEALWRRGGDKALTMRALAKAAGTNTPTVYRRFKSRKHLLRSILMRVVTHLRYSMEQEQTPHEIADSYLKYALRSPNEFRLFCEGARLLDVPKGLRQPRPIRESRPNFALIESALASELGGVPEDHSQLALQIWAIAHGTVMLLLERTVPAGHDENLRNACRSGIGAMIEQSKKARAII